MMNPLLDIVYDVTLSPQGRRLHSKGFRRRRLQNWLPMGVAYAAFYMARYNVSAGNVSSVRNQLGFSSIYMGWVLSAGSWAYAISSPFTGQITDRIGGRNGMIVACFGAGLCNLALGIALAQVLWLRSMRHGTGSTIIDSLGWAYVFIIPACMLLVMSIIVSALVKNSPADTNLLSPDLLPTTSAQNEDECSSYENEIEVNSKQRMKQLMKNYTFLGYLVALFFLCWTRDGFLNWFLSFFDDVRSEPLSSDDTAIIGGAWTIGGFVGGILCGWISDVVFKSNRVKPIFIFSMIQGGLLGVIYFMSETCSVMTLGLLTFASSVCILGNYTLLSYTVPTDLPQEIAAGATGVMHAVGYFSTGLSSAVMGNVIDEVGYHMWVISLIAASVLSGVFVKLGSHFSRKVKTGSRDQPVAIMTMTDASYEHSNSSASFDGDFTMVEETPNHAQSV
ncbi:glycerol-3-phosphate transporter [Plasmopara halstedii]|uniref:Glycerol-3-phosphate transporter n=1 Tax=Plasmopara halstedii TaxID=4781 RepID=A0A0P1B7J5_PLAHL|nr:glycerol-3-phosphate transporter [Plasmopara halstedii]CEG50505.1 glycerol-3-phosphate transporter [Plasmopara halstedii]|eukprot:XP_024586874.1 glycerol-3-phosphate transporter [Plasmopara halstedii]